MAILHIYGPELQPGDARVPTFFSIVDEVLGEVSLRYVLKGMKWVGPIDDRVERVDQALPWPMTKKQLWTFGTGTHGKKHVYSSLLNSTPGLGLSGDHPWRGAISIMKVDVNDEYLFPDRLPMMLERLGPALNAYRGEAQSRTSHGLLAKQAFRDFLAQSKRDLRVLLPDGRWMFFGLDWINYWSDDIAAYLQFPDATRDSCLQGLYHRVDSKGWLVQLTPEPLDVRIPEHHERFLWALDRFSTKVEPT